MIQVDKREEEYIKIYKIITKKRIRNIKYKYKEKYIYIK